jgi:hypothetical protein
MRSRTCDDCHAPIRWARTVNDKWIALDPDPDPAGNQAAYRDATDTFRTRQLRKDAEPQAYERRYMPHVATCTKRKAPQPPRLAPVATPPNVIPIGRARGLRRGNPVTPLRRRGNAQRKGGTTDG